jgi:Flp pilus assembly protein TadD
MTPAACALSSHPQGLDALLAEARRLRRAGRSSEAYAAYLEILKSAPSHTAALHELGALAYAQGHRAAARTLYGQIVAQWPDDLAGRINLGTILCEEGDPAAAETHFAAAIAIDPDAVEAQRGLAQLLSDRGEVRAADRHWRRSFAGQGTVPQPYRGEGSGIAVLLLVSTAGGNIPTRTILDDRLFAVTALYAEYYRPDLPLPPHALLFNAIGDADLCAAALKVAEEIAKRSAMPLINPPARVRPTGRAANAARLAAVPGVRAPVIRVVTREALCEIGDMAFPLLVRAQGFHTGQHFVRVARREDLQNAVAPLPGDRLLVIEYLDARGPDGLARKYRVMCIDGVLYPLHLAISESWKVHYFTAGMTDQATWRAEEQRFLEDMPGALGAQAMAALAGIGAVLGLDYAGIDFALDAGGTVLLFEANATMVINPPPAGALWDYRRAPIARALAAAQRMLCARAGCGAVPK